MDIYKKLDYILYVFLAAYNCFSRIKLALSIRTKRLIKHNRDLKRNKDHCFILGNGPSLKGVNLMELNVEDTFAVNYFYKHCTEGFKSRFFVAVDQMFYKTEQREYILNLYDELKDVEFILKTPAFGMKKDWEMNRSFFIYPKLFQYGKNVKCDFTKNTTACINVVIQCIQLAIFMGYKKIYLLGCDFTQYAQVKSNHFYDTKKDDDRRALTNMGDDARWAYLAHYHHYALQRLAEKRGIEIINLTENSLIDAYRFESYQDVVKRLGLNR